MGGWTGALHRQGAVGAGFGNGDRAMRTPSVAPGPRRFLIWTLAVPTPISSLREGRCRLPSASRACAGALAPMPTRTRWVIWGRHRAQRRAGARCCHGRAVAVSRQSRSERAGGREAHARGDLHVRRGQARGPRLSCQRAREPRVFHSPLEDCFARGQHQALSPSPPASQRGLLAGGLADGSICLWDPARIVGRAAGPKESQPLARLQKHRGAVGAWLVCVHA